MPPKLQPGAIHPWDIAAAAALEAVYKASGMATIPESAAVLAAALADALIAERQKREEGYQPPAAAPAPMREPEPPQGFADEIGEPGT